MALDPEPLDFQTLRLLLRQALASDEPLALADDQLAQGQPALALVALAAAAARPSHARAALERTVSVALLELGEQHWRERDHALARRAYEALCVAVPQPLAFVRARLASCISHTSGNLDAWLARLRELPDRKLGADDEALFAEDVRELLQHSPESAHDSLRRLLGDADTAVRSAGLTVLQRAGTPAALAAIVDMLPALVHELAPWTAEALRELLKAPATLGRWSAMQERFAGLNEVLQPGAGPTGEGRAFLDRLRRPLNALQLPVPVATQGMVNGPAVLQRLREWEQQARGDRNEAAVAAQRHPFTPWLRAAAGEVPFTSAAWSWPTSNITSYLVCRTEIGGQEIYDGFDGLQAELQFSWSREGDRFFIPPGTPLLAAKLAERGVRVAIALASHPDLPATTSGMPPRKAGVVLRLGHLTQHLMNELSFLDKALAVGVHEAIGAIYVVADPIVPLESLFPELAPRMVRVSDAEVFERAAADGVSLLPGADFFVSPGLARRIQQACRAAAEPDQAAACEQLRGQCSRLLLLALPDDATRPVPNWREAMQAVLAQLVERVPGLGCLVLGPTLAREAPPNPRAARVHSALADELFAGSLAAVPRLTLAGSRVATAIHAASLCDAYLAPIGRQQALAGWAAARPGVVYCASAPAAQHPMFRCVPPAQHPVVVVAASSEATYQLDPAVLVQALAPLL